MKKFIPLTIFAAAFGLVEAAVVVYTRWLYYPAGFAFPVNVPPIAFLKVELWRELATLAMLGAAGAMAGRGGWQKFAFFMWAFGVWDIFYYVWLNLFIGWPASPFDPDILFLIPVTWWGPVLSPCIVSISMCAAALVIVRRGETGQTPILKPLDVIGAAIGACIILYTYMADAAIITAGEMPPPYRWGIFWIGELVGTAAFINMLMRKPDGRSAAG